MASMLEPARFWLVTRPARVYRRCRGGEAYRRARRIAAQIPHRAGNDSFGAAGQPVVRRFHIFETEPLDGEFLGVHPLQLGGGSGGLGQQRSAAQRDQEMAAIHGSHQSTEQPRPLDSARVTFFALAQYNDAMAAILRNLQYSLRSLRKSPVFLAVAVLSLALGIGANTAIFTLVYQLILQPLPVRDPEQLVMLAGRGNHYGGNNGPDRLSYPMYQEIRDKNQVFSGMFCTYPSTVSASFQGSTELIGADFVSGNFFPVLGIGAAVGRVFTASDDLIQGGHPLAVLSHGYWRARFGADPGDRRQADRRQWPLAHHRRRERRRVRRRGTRPRAADPHPHHHEGRAAAHRFQPAEYRPVPLGRGLRPAQTGHHAARRRRPGCSRCSTRSSAGKSPRSLSPKPRPSSRASS